MASFTNLGDLIPRDRDYGKVAIVDLAGGVTREISYGQLDAMANGVARALCARGSGPCARWARRPAPSAP